MELKISPNASKCELIKTETEVKIKLTAQPIEGKANKCLIEFLSKTLANLPARIFISCSKQFSLKEFFILYFIS